MRQLARGILIGFMVIAIGLMTLASARQEPDQQTSDPSKLENPVPVNAGSIAAGKKSFMRSCRVCHGADGKGKRERGSLHFPSGDPADLTDPAKWKNIKSDGELFAAIRDVAKEMTESEEEQVTDEPIWQVVIYVRSLQNGVVDETAGITPQTKNPIAYTKASIAQGKTVYLRNCQKCHGVDGKSLDSTDLDASDLTDPEMWYFGTSTGQIFLSIRDGAGEDMPAFKFEIKDEKLIWNMVNFIRSIGPASMRPELQDEE